MAKIRMKPGQTAAGPHYTAAEGQVSEVPDDVAAGLVDAGYADEVEEPAVDQVAGEPAKPTAETSPEPTAAAPASTPKPQVATPPPAPTAQV